MTALRAGDEVDAVFALHAQGSPDRAHGSAYLALELRDRTGTIPARASATPTSPRRSSTGRPRQGAGPGGPLPRRAAAGAHRSSAPTPGGRDPADFLPMAYRDLDELDGFLEHLAARSRPGLRGLLGAFLDDAAFRAAFRRAPCTRDGHHAYLGGLLEHTVAVATLAQETCVLHPRLDSDLLIDGGAPARRGQDARVLARAPRSR